MIYLCSMELCRDYFPTRAYRIAEAKMGSLLGAERDRLDALAARLGRPQAVGPDNLREELPRIVEFTKAYHAAYDQYLKVVSKSSLTDYSYLCLLYVLFTDKHKVIDKKIKLKMGNIM